METMKQNGRAFKPTLFEQELILKFILQVVLKADKNEIETAGERELTIEEICNNFRDHTRITLDRACVLRYVKTLSAQGKLAMRKGTRISDNQWAVMTTERYLQVPKIIRDDSIPRKSHRPSTRLVLHVDRKYFEQIQSGKKKKEYRKLNKYYTARVTNPNLKTVEIILGYPSREREPEKFLLFKWNGYAVETITHEKFGNAPDDVYSIFLTERIS